LRNEVLSLLDDLDEDNFYDPKHQVIFAAIRSLEDQTKAIDEVTLEAQLSQMGKLDAVGGLAALSKLALRVPTADNVVHYAKTVKDLHAARSLMLAASEIAGQGYEDFGDIESYLDESEAKIFEVTQRQHKGGAESLKALLKGVFSSLDERF
jgi:replicative DNA helicase